MTTQAYVYVPQKKFSQMQAICQRSGEESSPTETAAAVEDPDSSPNDHADESLPIKKDLTKPLKEQQMTMLIDHLDELDSNIRKDFPNLNQLVKNCFGTSQVVLDNEKKFFRLLRRHNLMSFVHNPHKLKAYYPGSFFKI